MQQKVGVELGAPRVCKVVKKYFAAFKASGGLGDFLALPANGKDGHGVFTRDPSAWRPQVLEVLRINGLVR